MDYQQYIEEESVLGKECLFEVVFGVTPGDESVTHENGKRDTYDDCNKCQQNSKPMEFKK